MFPVGDVPCGRCFVVEKERETLAEYVTRIRREKRLSLTDVHLASSTIPAERIARSHISRIENGVVTNLGQKTLQALARGLDVAEDTLFDIARGKVAVDEADLADDEDVAALFYKYKGLDETAKKEIRRLLEIVDREIDRIGGQNP